MKTLTQNDSEFQSSIQIEHSQDCIDTEPILKELNVEFDSELESKQRDNKHRKGEGFKITTLICFQGKNEDAAAT